MSKKITSQDIFDDKIFDKIKSDANSFKTTLENLKTQFSAILGQQQQFLQQKVSFASAADLKKLNDVLEQNKALRQSLIAIQNKLNQVQNQGASTTSKLTKEKVREAEARKRKRKELVDEIALEEKQNVSLNKLLASSRKLRRERADLDLATAKGRQRLQEINVQLDKNNALIRKNSDALKKQRLNVGNYSSALGNAVGKLRNLAGAFGLVAGAAGVVSIFRNAIGVFRTFEQVQTDLASILQKTREETVGLSEAAKDLGATTFFTATEVSKLQVELAKLGFDTQQIIDSEKAILDLAAAFSIDLPQAAKVVASTLNGFQLEASESGRVADVLAKSFAKSALDIEKFEVAISKVAPIAAGLGIDIETTTAALGKLVSAGFDASTAGTQFRNILLKLSDPSSELANTLGFTVSNSDDLVESFKTLNKEQLSIAEAQGLIDVRSVALLKSLSDNSQGVQELREELENAAGTAEDISGKQLKTLNGSIRLLSSAYEGFILSIEDGTGSIAEFLRGILQVTTGVFNLLVGTKEAEDSFNKLDTSIQNLARNIFFFFNILKQTISTIFDYRRVILAVVVALKSYRIGVRLANLETSKFIKTTRGGVIASALLSGNIVKMTKAVKLLTKAIRLNPLGLFISLITTAASAFLLWSDTVNDAAKDQAEFNKELKKTTDLFDSIKPETVGAAILLKDFATLGKASLNELRDTVQFYRNELDALTEDSILLIVKEGETQEEYNKRRAKAFEKQRKEILEILGLLENEIELREKANQTTSSETGLLNQLRAELKRVREARDAAESEADIEAKNKRIKLLQTEIKRLEELGLAEENLAKIRLNLDKFIANQRIAISKKVGEIQTNLRTKELTQLEEELETFSRAFDDILTSFDREEQATKTVGKGIFARRVALSEDEKNKIKDDLVAVSDLQRKSFKEIADAQKRILETQFAFEKKTIEDSAKLRDIDLDKQRLNLEKTLGIQDKTEDEKLAFIESSNEDVKAAFEELDTAEVQSEKRKNREIRELKTSLDNDLRAIDSEYKKSVEETAEATAAAIKKVDEDVADAEFELFKRRLSNTQKFLDNVLSSYEENVKRRNELEAKAAANSVSIAERAADQQFQRAVAGQDNILQFQERKLAEARLREQRAAEQAAKKEDAARLAGIYFKALEVRLIQAAKEANDEKQTGKKAIVTASTAPLLALKDTFLAEALSRTISGAFATGVENFQGKGTETSDSNLIAFSHGESVVTAKGTKENRGLVTAMNKGMVDEYFKTMWLPKFQMDNSPSLIANFVNKDNKSDDKLAKKIEELTQVMANKPVQQVHVDSFGNIIETSYQNGLKTVIKHQTKKIL